MFFDVKKSYDYELAAAKKFVGSELRRVLKGQQLDQYCSKARPCA